MENIAAIKMQGKVAELIASSPGHEYLIVVELTAGAGASVVSSPATLIGSIPFAWEELGAHWDESTGDWEIKITDNGDNTAFSAVKIPLIALVGDNKQPYVLRNPWVFDGGSSIYVEATNNGSSSDTLYLLFIGKRLTARSQIGR